MDGKMIKIAVVGCTGKLGSAIMKNALKSKDVDAPGRTALLIKVH